jgi:16S rRNA (guanine527-N7)-methyltransferase
MIDQDAACQHLSRGLESLGLAPLPSASLSQLWLYFTELAKWNRTINLVAQAPDPEILENHFLDSLTLLPELTAGPLLDVGSGAGFPGLVLKIARPELSVTLLEPRQKRVSFLRHIIRTLQLTGIEVVDSRLEGNDQAFSRSHGQFSIITCRALAEIAPFLAMVEAISPPQGQVLCMKGPKANEELAAWREQSPGSPFAVERQLSFSLPFSGARRSLIIFKKHPSAAMDTKP